MEKKKGHYGLTTAIAMIVGIVVGSGIFFKADDILIYTGGSVRLGIIAFMIGAISIIFGSLSLIELSLRSTKSGGVIAYYEEFLSDKVASAFGWFQIFVYFPSLIVVVSWVAAIYTCTLFNVNATLEGEIIVAVIYMILIFAMNVFKVRLGGWFQNFSTVAKLIPLLGIAFAGFFLKTVAPTVPEGVEVVTASGKAGFTWLAALIPIAFSFDGWIVSTSISNEVKNPHKTMQLAFIIGPLTCLLVYLLYFTGFSRLLGTEYIMSTRNDAVYKAGEYLFGTYGTKIILVFLIIAVLGVVNGMIIGSIRSPHALAKEDIFPWSNKVKQMNEKYELSLYSCLVSFIIALVWMLIHYIAEKTKILNGGDVSEIAIVFAYVCYVFLYVKAFMMRKRGEVKSNFFGYVCPVLATIGSVIILVGGIIANPVYIPVFTLICLTISLCGYYYCVKARKNR